MSGFVCDAKAARVAIAARGPKFTAAAVVAVLAVEGRVVAQKPQDLQGKPIRTAIAQPQEPQQPQGVSFPASAVSADEIEERKATAMGSVPDRYLDFLAQFQSQCPGGVSEVRWRQVVDDAGRFLDAFGASLAAFEWTPGELFAAPSPDGRAGVVWWLAGREASAVGHDNVMCSGPVYDRTTWRDWIGYQPPPIHPRRPVWPDTGLPNRILTNLNGGHADERIPPLLPSERSPGAMEYRTIQTRLSRVAAGVLCL